MSEFLIAHIGHTTKSCEHITWWKPDSRGYTVCIEKAGLYSEQEARSICQYGSCIAVRKPVAEPISRPTPYFRRPNGELQKLYDGGPHRVVPNSRTEWQALMQARIQCGETEKATPIGAKARAIYLPADIGASAERTEGGGTP